MKNKSMKKYIAVIVSLLFSATIFAQSGPFVLKVSGEVTTPLALSLQDIAAMPHHTDSVKDKSGILQQYSGVTIQDILKKAGVTVGKELRGENLAKYVVAKCADGYQVLYSLAELDSSFSNKPAMIADAVNNNPLPENKGPLRVIISTDKIPARNCFQVTELIVHYAKE
jgi:DMSO/TMAO reductase YedYZ molybdopterin-dependent catalytic subunit